MKDRIKIMIERENLSQAEFSRLTGINTSTLSHVLTGRNNPSIEVINKILTAFPKYNSAWLVNGDGEPTKDNNSTQQTSSQSLYPPYHSHFPNNHRSASQAQPTISQGESTHHTLFTNEDLEDLNASSNQNTLQATTQPLHEPTPPTYSSQVASDPYVPYGFSENLQQKPIIQHQLSKKVKVTKIIVYYEDNTFESFVPEKES